MRYLVLLGSPLPEALRSRFPTATAEETGAQTALLGRGIGPQQLDVLLDKLGSFGIPLLEIHQLPGCPEGEQAYEVRVAGEVGQAVLRYLNWTHRIIPPQTRVRITAAPGELHEFLRACTESDTTIQRVRRVGYSASGSGTTTAHRHAPVSRARACDPGAPRPPVG